MVKTKLIVSISLLLLTACQPSYRWKTSPVDAHLTGVRSVRGVDYEGSLGCVDSVYHAPSGRVFSAGATPRVASILIAAQPEMAYLKEIIGYSPVGMERRNGDSPLSNWVTDALMLAVQSLTGCQVDVAIMNCGGIRCDMPEGDVMYDDILSMLPFNNRLCFVSLKGREVRAALDHMAERAKPDAVAGVRFVIKDGKAQDIIVAGTPLDDEKTYGLATIDFLLDGGDGYYLGRNALELVMTKERMRDWFVPYLRTQYAGGEIIESVADGRIQVL